MKRTLLTIATLTMLVGTPALVHADNTNTPSSSTNTAVKPYPLDYCLVSGEKLGGMGKPVTTVYQGQEIKFCCASCPADFKKNPDKYMKKLAEAEAKMPAMAK